MTGGGPQPGMDPKRAQTAEALRVLIVDDHALFRRGLQMVLASEPDIEVVGEAADGADALEKAKSLKPDVVLMDVRMPRLPVGWMDAGTRHDAGPARGRPRRKEERLPSD